MFLYVICLDSHIASAHTLQFMQIRKQKSGREGAEKELMSKENGLGGMDCFPASLRCLAGI